MDSAAAEHAHQTAVLNYSYYACLTFLLWETCITFADEVDFLCSSPRFRWTKVAYFLLRYYVVLVVGLINSSEAVCQALHLCGLPYCTRWYIFSTASLQIVAALQQFLMASRVYALYGRSRRIYHTLVWSFVAEHAVMVLFTTLTVRSVTWFGLCAADHVSNLSVGIGLPPILYDALLLVLTVRECLRGRWRRAALPSLLLRDGVWAFAVVFSTYAVQGIFFLVLSGPLASIAWAWQFAASSLAACRLVLHTHREGAAVRGASASSADSAGLALTTFVAGLDSDDIAEET